MVEKVDPVLGLKDSSQVSRWEEAIRNPKGFIASQAPFTSDKPFSAPSMFRGEEEEKEKESDLLPSMVEVTETRTGEKRVIPPRALSPDTRAQERRAWSQPLYSSEGISPQRVLFTPISIGSNDDLFGNTQSTDKSGKQIRPDVKFLDDPLQPVQATALGVKTGMEFGADVY